MEKNIKEYLHLYLGCGLLHDGLTVTLNPVRLELILDYRLYKEYLLILRPLSDMTHEEADHFAWLCMNHPHPPEGWIPVDKEEIEVHVSYNDGGVDLDDDVEIYLLTACCCWEGYIAIMKDGRIGISDDSDKPTTEMQPIDDVYGKVRFLLSKHFDLFGLIEAGLAIDATTLKQ